MNILNLFDRIFLDIKRADRLVKNHSLSALCPFIWLFFDVLFIFSYKLEVEGEILFRALSKMNQFNSSIRPECIILRFALIRCSDQSHHFSSNNLAIVTLSNRLCMGFAGISPTIVYGGMSFVTTARLQIIATPQSLFQKESQLHNLPIHHYQLCYCLYYTIHL